jgi:hypothetical protein
MPCGTSGRIVQMWAACPSPAPSPARRRRTPHAGPGPRPQGTRRVLTHDAHTYAGPVPDGAGPSCVRSLRARAGQFAAEYETEEKVPNAVRDFGSWHAIGGLPGRGRASVAILRHPGVHTRRAPAGNVARERLFGGLRQGRCPTHRLRTGWEAPVCSDLPHVKLNLRTTAATTDLLGPGRETCRRPQCRTARPR